LQVLSGRLEAAGVDTKNLGKEQERLAAELDTVSKKSENLGKSMQKL
jgi:hypothetical protein